ncbi:B12-binding domain-containing radical SAM protein [Aliikangiella coralliicola]|uniref:B12-binding domain-containing radical SAM protein n=1 Tax=Aliikangiella coralliicola TaxID=2592383 RepID=A0A545UJ69_9GAMM|nr:radical SAM protein [Aliikangiella coralliicola]TQV89505.1 B12-binding domain-containing radical SAM protein [Aliikangiella coralliicola]
MPDILLTHGYFLFEDEKEQEIMRPYVPLGLLYLSSYLKHHQISVEIFDSTFKSRSELIALFQANPGGIVGIYTNLMTRPSVVKIIQAAKKYNWTVITGGPESANYIENYLLNGADFVVLGEGEQTTKELVQALKDNNELGNIAGLAFFDKQGKLIRTAARNMPRNISEYPWPDREAIDIQKYLDVWQEFHGESSVSMITARGCPYQCKWCSHAVFGFSHRRREPAECADELEHIVNRYNPTKVWYADDVFTINHRWLFRYAEELKKRKLKVPFETISRADRMMDEKVVDTLKELGCYRVWIGAESGSQRLLDHMKRKVTIEQVYQATKSAQRRGIEVGMFLMWGYADENIDDIDETVRQVAKINPDIYLTTVAYPIKGTEYFAENQEKISIQVKWEDGSDRDYQISGRRSARYYRYANRYLKNTVEFHRLKDSGSPKLSMKLKHAEKSRKLLEKAAHE